MTVVVMILINWGVMASVMTVLWVVQRARNNAGIVDIAWSFGTGLVVVFFAAGVDGFGPRRSLVGVLAGLLKITGVPMTEERSLRSRGDAYRAYQRTTNRFFPGPPKTRAVA